MEHSEVEQLDMYATENGETTTLSYRVSFKGYTKLYVNFKLIFYYNKEFNRIDYRYSFFVPYSYCVDSLTVFDSIPESIDISTIEDEQSDLVKMMYSSEEYLDYLIKNKINIKELENKVISLLSDIMDRTRGNRDFSISKYLNSNPLNLEYGLSIEEKHNEYSVSIRYRMYGLTASLNLHIIFPANKNSGLIKYYYDIRIPFILDKAEKSDINEIDIGVFELLTQSKETICTKLVYMYHIVDKPFEKVIEQLEDVYKSFVNKMDQIDEVFSQLGENNGFSGI
jgi:hypothetical protein